MLIFPKEKKLSADTIRRIETVYAGLRMLDQEGEETTLRAAIWRLLQEAAQTQRSISTPGPRGDVSCMPEVYHSPMEIWVTEVAMAADKITYPPQIKQTASAAQIDRYVEVMGWLKYIRSRNKPRAQKAVALLSAGVSASRVADVMGYHSGRAVEGVRYRAISGIVERLKRDLPGDVV